MDKEDKRLRIAVEGRFDSLLIQTLIKKLDPSMDPFISVAGRPLTPAWQRTDSYLKNFAPGTMIVYDLEEGMIPDELPQRKNSSEFLFIPAIPTLEAWLLADPDWAAAELHLPKSEILRSFEGGKTSIAIIEMKKRIKNQFEQHPEKFAKRILEDFDVSTAASLSPSFGKFLEEIKTRSTSSTIPNRPRALVSKIGNAVFASLVAELQPVTKIVYKTADGHKHTAGDIRNAILAGNELGIAYMESVLRLARDFLSFQAEDEDDE